MAEYFYESIFAWGGNNPSALLRTKAVLDIAAWGQGHIRHTKHALPIGIMLISMRNLDIRSMGIGAILPMFWVSKDPNLSVVLVA